MVNKKGIHDRVLAIYAEYPRKMGKSAGLKKALVHCKSIEDTVLLRVAVKNYIAHLEREGTEPQYYLYFSTFMTQWRDWLEADIGSVAKLGRPDLSGMGFEK